MTRYWRYQDYITDEGINRIREWYLLQEPEVRARFDTALAFLATQQQWDNLKFSKPLERQHAGLVEIKFPSGDWKYRPVGIVASTPTVFQLIEGSRVVVPGVFALIMGCRKSGRIYEPADAFDVALEYRAALLEGKGELRDHDF